MAVGSGPSSILRDVRSNIGDWFYVCSEVQEKDERRRGLVDSVEDGAGTSGTCGQQAAGGIESPRQVSG